MVWCILVVTAALESNAPKMCFPERETCRAMIQQLDIQHAQCNQRRAR